MSNIPDLHHYIGGKPVASQSGETFANVNPATGETLCHVHIAGDPEIEKAIAAAKKGFAVWSKMLGTERGRVLNRAAAILRQRNDELARIEVLDTGKPIQEALEVDIISGADSIEYFAGQAASIGGEHVDLGGSFFYTRREPLGICVGIGAWNYPMQIACWKSAPALACGNVMIFKPSEMTPSTAAQLAEVYTEAGVPDGVFNVLQGNADTGRGLTLHGDVAKVSLTGSVGTGKKVMAAAAEGLKHVTMELGGKSPLIIFADADLDNAVSAAMLANFYTQGEVCSNGTRVFVERSIQDAFAEQLSARTAKLKIGDPLDPQTHVGSLISKDHLAKVMGYIDQAKNSGARLLCGGGQPDDPALAGGNYVEPTVFMDCSNDMAFVREEIFGPVMAVMAFDDEDDVIARANDTEFGLAAGVFTRDLARAHRVVAQLEAGTCWINNYNITPVEMPFGGYKLSGIGRENSRIAIEHYTQVKAVYVEMGDVDTPYA